MHLVGGSKRGPDVEESGGTQMSSLEHEECTSNDSSLLKKHVSDTTSTTDNEDTDDEYTFQECIAEEGLVPTLPRLCDSNDKNCWSEPSHEDFQVRGVNYLLDKKKVKSGPYLMQARGADVWLTTHPPENVGSNKAALGGSLRKSPTFIINFRFAWGVVVSYFDIPEKLTPFLRPNPPSIPDNFTPAEKTLARFFMGDQDYKNKTLKLIPYVPDGPLLARSMVSGKKPVIVGTKLPVSYTYSPPTETEAEYLESDWDMGNSSKTARRIVSICRRYMNSISIDFGFVIQGNSPDELPEQMMGCVRLHGPDPEKAPTVS